MNATPNRQHTASLMDPPREAFSPPMPGQDRDPPAPATSCKDCEHWPEEHGHFPTRGRRRGRAVCWSCLYYKRDGALHEFLPGGKRSTQ